MYKQNSQIDSNVGFAIGTGRCGTNFLAKLIELEPYVKSTHERNALNETFHRYCKWYNSLVDHEVFLSTYLTRLESFIPYRVCLKNRSKEIFREYIIVQSLEFMF